MDTFITVVAWIVGLYAGFALLMAIIFSGLGAAETGNSELTIASILSSMLLIYLIWMGLSSVIEDNVVSVVPITKMDAMSINNPSALQDAVSTSEKRAVSKSNYDESDFALWSIYMAAFVLFFLWIFRPSKKRGREKESVKKKFLASMTLKADETGLRPWNPNWNPEDDTQI